jgi:FkbM family methyltransferase
MIFSRLLPESWKDRLRHRAGAITPRARLENLHRAGFRPRKIIDAGAYHGEWSKLASEVFPTAAFLLIEAQPQLAPVLQRVCAGHRDWKLHSAALGARPGTARFLCSETNSRIVDPGHAPATTETCIDVPVKPLYQVADTEGFLDSDFLKLDLQGNELPALEGAAGMFGTVEVILSEVSWLQIGDAPLIHEVLARFHAAGYRPYDIWGFNYRPLDRALWQTDVLFVRADSPLLCSRAWSG